MRFLRGDVIREDDCEEQVLANEYSWELTAELIRQGWRLLRTAREEWDRKHAGAALCGGMRNIAGGVWPAVPACTVCGPRPTDSRSPEEIAALKAGKAVEPVLTREEWDAMHHSCGLEVELHLCDPRCRISVVRDRPTDKYELCCDTCGPRPPAQPVATEPAVVEPEHVPIEKSKPHVLSRISGWCYDAGKLSAEGDGSECPRCYTPLPSQLASLIRSGSHDCPSCGWHSGRCDHCHELLVPSYVVGERDHGRTHCPRCQGVDE